MTAASVGLNTMVPARHRVTPRRRLLALVMAGLLGAATLFAASLLVIIVGFVVARGLPALDLVFFTDRPRPFGVEGGGVAPAILGTLQMGGIAALIAVPIGMGAAIFASEYRSGRWAEVVRFAAELIAGLPSVAVGVFVWAFLVRGVIGNYAGLAGAVALAVIMIPIIARTVEEVLRLVPSGLREAGLALGAPRWRVIMLIVLPTARAGIVTAIVLSVVRAAGETAPLLLTALGNVFFNFDPLRPMAALPLQIYQYAVSPYDDWHEKAWGSSLILVAVIALLAAGLRFATRSRLR